MKLGYGLLLVLLLTGCQAEQSQAPALSLGELLGGPADGFLRAERPRVFSFPRDHLAHPGFRNEWWYLTGNLRDEQGRRYGYQVTFFRVALTPKPLPRRSAWGGDVVWLAHLALTDAAAGTHVASERLLRQGSGLAGLRSDPFSLWVGDWVLSGSMAFPWRLDLPGEGFRLVLDLTPRRAPMLQGRQGLSRKGSEPGNASYYYSITRLASSGYLQRQGRRVALQGESWLDREWSSSALEPEQVGWDWFALQFDSDEELMYYQLRRQDGTIDRHSAGVLVAAHGSRLDLDPGAIELTPLRWWRSPHGGRYPVAWRLRLLRDNRVLEVEPLLDDQYMDLSIRYWEGAVRILQQGREVGRGYLELTGY